MRRLTVGWEFGIPGGVLSRPTGRQGFMGWERHSLHIYKSFLHGKSEKQEKRKKMYSRQRITLIQLVMMGRRARLLMHSSWYQASVP